MLPGGPNIETRLLNKLWQFVKDTPGYFDKLSACRQGLLIFAA
jgi:hypothetical protein